MLCKNCGTQLTVKDGLYFCESCGSKFELSLGFESIEVFIAYIESDEQGRRTKDSIIGQDIYNKLESAKIKAYYQRISSSNITGSAVQLVSETALDNSKIVIILGTTPQRFENLLEQYQNKFKGKTIIPLYSDINAYDLPNSLKVLQALNYNSVGALSDLNKNVLKILGRENEIDIIDEADKSRKKRNKNIIMASISIFTIIVGICAYIVFGTTYVLPSKKYDYAQTMIDEEKYADAILMLNKITDYKNSSDLLSETYNKYNGYYQNEDKSIGLHISISDNLKASIEITRQDANTGTIKIIENAEIIGNKISVEFTDSENNQGNADIELKNTGIDLIINMDNGNEFKCFYDINNKSDKPNVTGLTADIINGWLKTRTNEQEIKSLGYELVFERALYKDPTAAQYAIKNTDVKIALIGYDISKTDGHFSTNDVPLDTKEAFGFSVPANVIIPDKIGQSAMPFVENDILYLPNAFMEQAYMELDFFVEYAEKIEEDMRVCCTSKALLSDEHWNELVQKYTKDYVYETLVEVAAREKYNLSKDVNDTDDWCDSEFEVENDTHCLYAVYSDGLNDQNQYALFKIEKATKKVEFVMELPKQTDSTGGLKEIPWQLLPEFFEEFPNNSYDY